jgi:Flp pilus assembly protein TadG
MRLLRGSRGQSVAEVAVALPFLVLLFCGLLDLGRAYYADITVTDAARDGARMLITSSSSGTGPGSAAGCTAVQVAVVDLASSPTCPTSGTSPAAGQVLVAISCPDGTTCTGPSGDKPVTVDVYYGFQLVTPVVSSLVPGGVIALHGHAVMDSTW